MHCRAWVVAIVVAFTGCHGSSSSSPDTGRTPPVDTGETSPADAGTSADVANHDDDAMGVTDSQARDTASCPSGICAPYDGGSTVADSGANGYYTLPAERVTTWKPGVTYNGGIPTDRPVWKTLTPAGADDTGQIQGALDSCPAKQVVLLGAGTFHITSTLHLTGSEITLRGSGADKTILRRDDQHQDSIIVIGPDGGWNWHGQVAFVEDAVKGRYQVTLASASAASQLVVGQVVHVNETYDESLVWLNPLRQTNDYMGYGEDRMDVPPSRSRPVGQAMEVSSVSGAVVTFSTPFHQTYRASHAAHLALWGTDATVTTRWSGIENLAVSGGGGGDLHGNIAIFNSAYCWAKNVESSDTIGGSIALVGSFRCEVRDSYMHHSADPNPGGGGYGLVLDTYTADSLAENNIVWGFNKVMCMRTSGGGNVIGYNYMEDGFGAGYTNDVETGLNASHMVGSHHELFEGNQSFNFGSDSYWGTQMYITAFRNHLTTSRRSVPGLGHKLVDEQSRRGIGIGEKQRWYSFVGNVIGYPDNYLQTPAIGAPYPAKFVPTPQADTFIYEWTGGNWGQGISTPMWQIGDIEGRDGRDPDVRTTMIRDANYDYFTKSVRWHGVGGEGQGQTPNPAPTLPASFYLTGKPRFFGNNPWPWIDGSNAAQPILGTLPARTRFDSGTPNTVP